MIGRECEAVTVGVWPDRATIRQATGGGSERPLFEQDLAEWIDRLHLETYDGIEIAPRLPAVSGPPIFVIDEDLRIVDITGSAAATVGWPAEDLVGTSIVDISLGDGDARGEPWERLLHEGRVSGESSFLVPDTGAVFLRFIARRDVPIVGRHTVLVHRWHEEPPTMDDLERALEEAFPGRGRIDLGGVDDLGESAIWAFRGILATDPMTSAVPRRPRHALAVFALLALVAVGCTPNGVPRRRRSRRPRRMSMARRRPSRRRRRAPRRSRRTRRRPPRRRRDRRRHPHRPRPQRRPRSPRPDRRSARGSR